MDCLWERQKEEKGDERQTGEKNSCNCGEVRRWKAGYKKGMVACEEGKRSEEEREERNSEERREEGGREGGKK